MGFFKHIITCGNLTEREKNELISDIESRSDLDSKIIWDDRNHEDKIFYDRITVFLLAETMLFVAYATLYGNTAQEKPILLTLATLGVLLTIIWLLVNIRQVKVLKHIAFIASIVIPTYDFIQKKRKTALIHSTRYLACFVPSVFLFAWLYLGMSLIT